MLDNFFKEIDGYEVEVLNDKRATKSLECVIRVSKVNHLTGFLNALFLQLGSENEPYENLCCSPYASHTIENVFYRIAELLASQQYEGFPTNLDSLISGFLLHLGSDLVGMSSNKSASYILRATILLTSGCKWSSRIAQTEFRVRRIENGIVPPEANATSAPMWPIFERLANTFILNLEKSADDARKFACDPVSSACMQLLLACLDARCRNAPSEKSPYVALRDRLVSAVTLFPPPASCRRIKDGMSNETSFFSDFAYDSVGSRLMELVSDRCCKDHFLLMARSFLLPQARDMALDQSANFVVNTALARLVTEKLDDDGDLVLKLVEVLCKPNLGALLQRKRYGVILWMLRGLSGMNGATGKTWRRRILVLMSQSEVPTPLLIELLGPLDKEGANVSRPVIDIACAMHQLQAEGSEVMDLFWDELTEDALAKLVKSRAWSEVVEAFLKGHSHKKSKQKLIRKMEANFVEMCRDKYAHHVAFTSFTVSGADKDAADIHAKLAKLLKKQREYISRNEWGTKLLKKVSVYTEETRAAAAANAGKSTAPAPKKLDLDYFFGDDDKKDKKNKESNKKRERSDAGSGDVEEKKSSKKEKKSKKK